MQDQDIPGWEGSMGPFPDQYTTPHVYARDIQSGAGNCVCGDGLGDPVHVQAAPGVEIPDRLKPAIAAAGGTTRHLGEIPDRPTPDPTRYLGKSAEEQRFVLGLAYQAGRDPLIAKGADGRRDFFTAEELEKACWSFLPGGAQVGLFHADRTLGHLTVTESYIYRGPDWDQGNGVVIKAGDWLIGGICDDIAWDLVKSGKVTGFSPQGVARRRPYTPPRSDA